jgi:phosphoserine phosphatase
VEEVLHKTIASTLQVLDAERGSVFLYDPKTNELYTKVSTGGPEAGASDKSALEWPGPNESGISHDIRFPANKGIAGETAQTCRLINVPDCYADPRFNREVDRQTGFVTRCLLSIPLLGIDNALVGVLQVLNKRQGTFDEDDEKIATTLAAHCAVALQRTMLLEEYVIKQRMERDLALAREIQIGSLPHELPALSGYELFAWSRPADETGGDIYDAVGLDDHRAALLMADATGHGIGPALSVSQLRAMFRMGLLLGADLGELMSKINLQLKEDLPSHRFVTAFAGILDSREHKIHYHSGGQAPLLHYHADRDEVEWLDASALPMGILARAPMIAPAPREMQPGDIFALISDGFFEYNDRTGEQFGRERVTECIRSHRREPLEQVTENLCESIHRFCGGAPQEDDMTIVLARRTWL